MTTSFGWRYPRLLTVAWPVITFTLLVLGRFDDITVEADRASDTRKPSTTLHATYLVHVPLSSMPSTFNGHARGWYSTLVGLIHDKTANTPLSLDDRMVYMYEHALEGFAIRLSSEEAESLGQLEEVATVVKDDAPIKLHTTHTPEFLELISLGGAAPNDTDGPLWKASGRGEGVIVGVLDTGIWPEHPSFDDAGFGPIPPRWKGRCDSSYLPSFDAAAACNRKLVGAKAFFSGYEAILGRRMNETLESRSPRDSDGHGTHTASTAVGSPAQASSFFGFAPGTASGMAPRSRLAVYKVCWLPGCFNADILAGFEAAITDGVDIISLSVGGDPGPYWFDSIAIGSFMASKAGILVSCSAGNDGPSAFTVSNVAPWIFTVAAGSLDRQFPASVTLGNGELHMGSSLYSGPSLGTEALPLIYAADAAAPGADPMEAMYCYNVSHLDTALINGKIVMCYNGGIGATEKGQIIRQAGGLGMILANTEIRGEMLSASPFVAPALRIGYNASLAVLQYLNSTKNPTAILDNGVRTEVGTKPAPAVAAFSSRGPNSVTPGIMKPDILAPGLDILAAWTGEPSASPIPGVEVEFSIISGTSMSCPHVAGISALLKSAHRDWSPAMIRSALMTTAYTLDNTGHTLSDTYDWTVSDPSGFGAGHINPNAALDPGLVYNISTQNYLDFICALDSTKGRAFGETCRRRRRRSRSRSPTSTSLRPIDLNYPSFSVVFNETYDTRPFTLTTSRTLTNVGPTASVYTLVSIDEPSFLTVHVIPTILSFNRLQSDLTYSVTFNFKATNTNFVSFGSLTWSDGVHNVTSPISFLVAS